MLPYRSLSSLGLVWLAAPLQGQSIRLSGDLAPQLAEVRTNAFQFSRSGASVVFLAGQGGLDELFAAPRDGSVLPARLHAPLAGTGRWVRDFAPCSAERVVFRADLDSAGTRELYLAPLDASAAPVVLSGAPGVDVLQYEVTSDGASVVFLAERTPGVSEPFVVALDGGSGPIPLDPAGNDWELFQLSPDRSSLFLVRTTGLSQGLFRVPLDASQLPTRVATSDSFSPPCLSWSSRFGPISLSADGQHLAYMEQTLCTPPAFCDEQYTRIFGVDTGTGSVTLLDSGECDPQYTLISGAHVLLVKSGALRTVRTDGTGNVQLGSGVSNLVLTPDGSQVVFQQRAGSASVLSVAPVDGSTPPRLLAAGNLGDRLGVSANSRLVVYTETLPSGFRALQSVSVDGAGPLLLNAPEVPGRGVTSFVVATAGAALAYREERELDGVFELGGLDLDLIPRRLAVPTPGSSRLGQFGLSPDGRWLAFLESWNSLGDGLLLGAPIDGTTAPVEYAVPPVPGTVGGDVLDFRVADGGRQVVYRADQELDQSVQLYARQADGLTPVRTLSAGLPVRGTVEPGYVLAADGARVAFAYRRGFEVGLYTTRLDGGVPLELERGASTYGLLTLASDAGRLVYRRNADELRSVVLDGSSAPLDLLGVSFGPIERVDLVPDGVHALVLAGGRLLRVRLDGSGTPLELGPARIPAGAVASFLVTPDGAHVVLRADAEVDERFELYVQPLDGSLPAQKRSATLVAGGSVHDFALAATAARIVYRADQTIDGVDELYSVPLSGGTPLRLTPLGAGSRVEADYRVSVAGDAVYHRSGASHRSLFRVPLDGSAAPLRLHATPRAGTAGVTSFEESADGARLAFLAELRVPGLRELSSVPAAGGSVTTLATVTGSNGVRSFRLGGGEAFFLVEDFQHRPFALQRVPLDGRRAPALVHAPLAPGLGLADDYVPLRSGVVFRGDLEADERFELFRSDPSGPSTTGSAARPTVTRTILR